MLSPEDITDHNGIPLSIIGSAEAYEFADHFNAYNKHHPEHPNAAEELTGLGGRVVRHSRVQIAPISTHDDYHDLELMPLLPTDESGQFKVTLLNHADCIADQVIDLSNPKNPKVRPLETSDMHKIRVKPEMGKVGEDGQWDSRRKTGQFLAGYLISQDVGHLKGEINRFLDTESADIKIQIAWQLIHEAANIAVKPIIPTYEKTVKIGIHSKTPTPRLTNVLFGIFTPNFMPDYVKLLEQRLRQVAA